MNGTTSGFNFEAVKIELETITQVEGIHYLHAWSVRNQSVAMTCHVVVPDQLISTTEKLGKTIRKKLFERFGIDHSMPPARFMILWELPPRAT